MLTEAQKDIKIAYLEQENNQLRSALLDCKIREGGLVADDTSEDPTEETTDASV